MRAPPASNRPTMGARAFMAMSWIFTIFCAWVSDSEPPNTVKSLANTKTVRPLTVPHPVTTPSPGILVCAMPNSSQRCSTNMSNSSNELRSSRSAMRSRAVSLPRLCWASVRFFPPPRRAWPRRCSSFARMSFIGPPCGRPRPCIADAPKRSNLASASRPCSPDGLRPAAQVGRFRLANHSMAEPGNIRVSARRSIRATFVLHGGQQPGRRLHLGEAEGAALERQRVAAPLLEIPVLVDMGRVPCVFDLEPAAQHRECQQRRPGQRRHRVQCPEPPRVVGDGAPRGGERSRRLLDEHHALREHEIRAELLARP